MFAHLTKELLACPFLDLTQPPPEMASEVSGPRGHRSLWPSLQTLVPNYRVIGVYVWTQNSARREGCPGGPALHSIAGHVPCLSALACLSADLAAESYPLDLWSWHSFLSRFPKVSFPPLYLFAVLSFSKKDNKSNRRIQFLILSSFSLNKKTSYWKKGVRGGRERWYLILLGENRSWLENAQG